MQPGFCHRIGGRRGRLDGLLGPHRADIDDGTTLVSIYQVFGHTLGDEKDGLADFEVAVVISLGVFYKRFWSKDARGIQQHGRVAVLGVNTFDKWGALGGFADVGSLTEDGTARSHFCNGWFCLARAEPNDRRRAPVLENDLGDRLSYSARSAADDQLLALKFTCHLVHPFDLFKPLEVQESREMLCDPFFESMSEADSGFTREAEPPASRGYGCYGWQGYVLQMSLRYECLRLSQIYALDYSLLALSTCAFLNSTGFVLSLRIRIFSFKPKEVGTCIVPRNIEGHLLPVNLSQIQI